MATKKSRITMREVINILKRSNFNSLERVLEMRQVVIKVNLLRNRCGF